MKTVGYVRLFLICFFAFFGVLTVKDSQEVEARESWGYAATGMDYFLKQVQNEDNEEIVVAVIDTGIDPAHPWFEGRLVPEEEAELTSKYEDARNWHGTMVTGVISKITPSNVKFVVFNTLARGSMIDSLRDVIELKKKGMNIKVVNMSCGNENFPEHEKQRLKGLVDEAYELGILIVAAVGNDSKIADYFYPAAFEKVIAVSALNKSMTFDTTYSNYGRSVDFAAPGTNICTAGHPTKDPNPCVRGTSVATPHITADIALLYTACPDCTVAQIEQVMIEASVDLGEKGKDWCYGYGYIDMEKAYDIVKQMQWEIDNPIAKIVKSGSGTVLLQERLDTRRYAPSGYSDIIYGGYSQRAIIEKYKITPKSGYYISKIKIGKDLISSAELSQIIKKGYIIINRSNLRNTNIIIYFAKTSSSTTITRSAGGGMKSVLQKQLTY